MQFTSITFLVLLFPCIILTSYVDDKYRNFFLSIISVLFYAWCGLEFLILVMASALVAYATGLWMVKVKAEKIRCGILIVGIAYHLVVLFYYKYFFDNVNWIVRAVSIVSGQELSLPKGLKEPILPLGISFYTFSILSYLLDVYWEKCQPQRKLTDFLLYVLFFPKVIQGPIVQYADFESQLQDRTVGLNSLNSGLELFVKGMVKKVMLADQLQPLVTYSFGNIGGGWNAAGLAGNSCVFASVVL